MLETTLHQKTMGIVAESIAANQVGFIVTQGVLDGLSLGSPYVAGDSIYLDTTPGAFTRVKPTQPNHIVFHRGCRTRECWKRADVYQAAKRI